MIKHVFREAITDHYLTQDLDYSVLCSQKMLFFLNEALLLIWY